MRRIVRETAFRLARDDILKFVEDHEEDLLNILREELQELDDRLPEEEVFIDIHLAALGEQVLLAALETVKRFLREA
jgi:polyphosphate kinase